MEQDNLLRAATANTLRRLPPFKGKTRAIRILNWAFLKGGCSPQVISNFKSGDLFKIDLRTRGQAVPHFLGDYEGARVSHIQRLLPKDAVAIDVGANIGFFSVPIAKAIPNGSLFCFEPVPGNFDRLSFNLKLNALSQVKVYRIALSNKDETLFISRNEGYEKGSDSGNAAICRDLRPENAGDTFHVEATTLDAWESRVKLSRLDFIKVDIEGHEDRFLAGARSVIVRFRPIILAELCTEWFDAHGVDVDSFVAEYFRDLSYVALDSKSGKQLQSLRGRKLNTDDALLVPTEKLGAVTTAFAT